MIENTRRTWLLPVTNLGCSPGDFPIGSPESRAAIRMRLAHLLDNREWVTLFVESKDEGWHFGPWKEAPDGGMVRIASMPILCAALPVAVIPVCKTCGAPLKKDGQYKNIARFVADCLEVHDPEPSKKHSAQPGYVLSEAERSDLADTLAMIHVIEAEEREERLVS